MYDNRKRNELKMLHEAFNYKFTFQHSRIANAPRSTQLEEWGKSLQKHGLKGKTTPNLHYS